MNIAEIQKTLDVSKTAYEEAEYNYEEAIVDFIKAFLQEHNGEYKFDTSCVIAVTDGGAIDITEVSSVYIDDVDEDTIMVPSIYFAMIHASFTLLSGGESINI